MTNPMVSVIIPTAGTRPQLLQRAVGSALDGAVAGSVEVIVVPNGPSAAANLGFADLAALPAVRVSAIGPGNASAARNHGLALARGRLVRFLDDDDFLVSDVAQRQYAELLASTAAGSSYAVRIEDEHGRQHATLHQPDGADFVAGQLGSRRLPLPLAHVYRREVLRGLAWNETFRVAEDIAWLHAVVVQPGDGCLRGDAWLRSDEVVGVWFQHSGPRLTYAYSAHEPNRNTAASILAAVDTLARSGHATAQHRAAAAEGLWICIHRGFPFHPAHWHRVARRAEALAPGIHRSLPIYNRGIRGKLPPLLIEWLLVPARLSTQLIRRLRGRLFGWSPVRNL